MKDIFNTFYSTIFQIGKGTPIINYYWQVGSFTVENLILQKKLMFWFHIKNLPNGSLAKEVLEKQEEKELFSLTTELEEELKELRITDPCNISKWQYKRQIKKYVTEKNRKYLLEESKKYKKMIMKNGRKICLKGKSTSPP